MPSPAEVVIAAWREVHSEDRAAWARLGNERNHGPLTGLVEALREHAAAGRLDGDLADYAESLFVLFAHAHNEPESIDAAEAESFTLACQRILAALKAV